jgi:hypothetical protein
MLPTLWLGGYIHEEASTLGAHSSKYHAKEAYNYEYAETSKDAEGHMSVVQVEEPMFISKLLCQTFNNLTRSFRSWRLVSAILSILGKDGKLTPLRLPKVKREHGLHNFF